MVLVTKPVQPFASLTAILYVPAARLLKLNGNVPGRKLMPSILNSNGAIEFTLVTVMLPLLPPKQLTSATEAAGLNASFAVTVTIAVAVHRFVSVTVTE